MDGTCNPTGAILPTVFIPVGVIVSVPLHSFNTGRGYSLLPNFLIPVGVMPLRSMFSNPTGAILPTVLIPVGVILFSQFF